VQVEPGLCGTQRKGAWCADICSSNPTHASTRPGPRAPSSSPGLRSPGYPERDGPPGNMHLAFAMTADSFDQAFARIRTLGVPFGDTFHESDNVMPPRLLSG
jgi:hypothetical protein